MTAILDVTFAAAGGDLHCFGFWPYSFDDVIGGSVHSACLQHRTPLRLKPGTCEQDVLSRFSHVWALRTGGESRVSEPVQVPPSMAG